MTLLEFFLMVFLLFLAGCLIIYLIYGSFRGGRHMGGVAIVYAPPGEGKSYVSSDAVVKKLKVGRECYTNFPIITPDLLYISKIWIKKLMKENIFDSFIVIDESYKDYNSREYKTFSKDDHDFFATAGHNQNTIWLITQNPQRIDTIIREVANFFIFVEKTEIPLLEIPLCFNLYYYRSEEEMRVSKYGMAEPWFSERIWFNWYVASSYDTRFFKKPADTLYHGKSWLQIFEERKFEYKPPIPSGIAFLKMVLNRQMTRMINYMKKRYSDIGQRFDKNLEKEEEKEDELKRECEQPGEEMFEDDS